MRASESTHGTAAAEIIFTGGRVHTVNATNDVVEALAIGGGRILAVGGNTDIRALAGSGTCEVVLHGRSLLPGFIDAHCHSPGQLSALARISSRRQLEIAHQRLRHRE